MNRFHRLLTRPLFFALLATGMVVAVGEPVATPMAAGVGDDTAHCALAAADLGSPVETLEVEVNTETEVVETPIRAEQAARLRWLITLPHARSSCCRQPV
ncbi:hypothetical protein [Pseudomarimonas salicorniae]|uniref:Secreted protein n=1 Tax=Pseudomarimonas salicorniae TaxID=2933270 RepID=A0ABT0GED8_9GAMM|nr:hypothetical protein [Lysobacter sp. CAU 1642]MCK7592915.1 hypothetical protein [Lysobacter sp. CAU 1642]